MSIDQSFLGCPFPCLATVIDDPARERARRIWGTLLIPGWNTNASLETNDISHVWIETGKTAS